MPFQNTWDTILRSVLPDEPHTLKKLAKDNYALHFGKLCLEQPASALLDKLSIETRSLDLKKSNVGALTVIIQSLFYGSYPPVWSFQYSEENQKILDHWHSLSPDKKTLFVRVAILAADVLFYKDTQAVQYYQRLYLDFLQNAFDRDVLLAFGMDALKDVLDEQSSTSKIISSRLHNCLEKIEAYQDDATYDLQKSLRASIAYTYLEFTLPDRKPDIPHFYLRCKTIFNLLEKKTEAKQKTIFSYLANIFSSLHISYQKKRKRKDEEIKTLDLPDELKTSKVAPEKISFYIKCFLAATNCRIPKIKITNSEIATLDEDVSRDIAGLITHLITAFTENHVPVITEDSFVQLIIALQEYCFEATILSDDEFSTIAEENTLTPSFLSSQITGSASDDYFFHWMAAFISNASKDVFEPSQNRNESFDRKYTTAAYFALSQIQRNGADNAANPQLYYSIHHTYHSFREQGTAPRQDLWLLAWTKHLLKDAPSTLAENFFLKFQFLSPENLNRSLTLPEAIQSDTVTELYRLYPDKFAHVSHLTITGQNADFIKETLHLFPHLTHLTCQNCKLENLDTIRDCKKLVFLDLENALTSESADFSTFACLQHLTIANNTFTTLPTVPDSLVTLNISNNPLAEPLTLSYPFLQKIQLKACGLHDVPQLRIENGWLDTLTHPLEIDLSNNPISDLDCKAFNLPPEVTLILENNNIPKENLRKIQRTYKEENYHGPTIISNFNTSPEVYCLSIPKIIERLTRYTGIHSDNLESLSLCNIKNYLKNLKIWLNKILFFLGKQNANYRKFLSEKVVRFLQKLNSEIKQDIAEHYASFTQKFFNQIVAHNDSCPDAAHISILNIDFLFTINTRSNNPEQVLKQIISFYALNQLRSFDIKSIDPIETYANLAPLVLKELETVSSDEIDFQNLSGIITPVDHTDVVSAIEKLFSPLLKKAPGKKAPRRLRSDWIDQLFVDGRQIHPVLRDLLIDSKLTTENTDVIENATLLKNIQCICWNNNSHPPEEFTSAIQAYISNPKNGKEDLTTLFRIDDKTLCQEEDLTSFIDKLWQNIFFEDTLKTDEKFTSCWIQLLKQFIGSATLKKYQKKYEDLLQKYQSVKSRQTQRSPTLEEEWMCIDSYPVLDQTISPIFSDLSDSKLTKQEFQISLPHSFIQAILFIEKTKKEDLPKMLQELHSRYRGTVKKYDEQDIQKLQTDNNYTTLRSEWQCAPYILNALFPRKTVYDSTNSDATKVHKFLNSVFLLFSHYHDAKINFPSDKFDEVFAAFYKPIALQYIMLTGCYLTVARFHESIETEWDAFPKNIFQVLIDMPKETLDFDGAFNTIQAFEGRCTLEDTILARVTDREYSEVKEAFNTFEKFRQHYTSEGALSHKIKLEEKLAIKEAFKKIYDFTNYYDDSYADRPLLRVTSEWDVDSEKLPNDWKNRLDSCENLLTSIERDKTPTKMWQERFQALTDDWKRAQQKQSDLLKKIESLHEEDQSFYAKTEQLLRSLKRW